MSLFPQFYILNGLNALTWTCCSLWSSRRPTRRRLFRPWQWDRHRRAARLDYRHRQWRGSPSILANPRWGHLEEGLGSEWRAVWRWSRDSCCRICEIVYTTRCDGLGRRFRPQSGEFLLQGAVTFFMINWERFVSTMYLSRTSSKNYPARSQTYLFKGPSMRKTML